MPCTRQELEERERSHLAPQAQLSVSTRGREHLEPAPEWRTHFQRDRDRVIHSRSFRRLEYKTQVFLNGTGDHLRTRLTHSIEVSGISRNIARALRLNEDLTETIALAHDLGHSPFGHRGEAVLDKLMAAHGGFEHNRQSLRIVEELEQKYPGFNGLNLTWESREGLAKHRQRAEKEALLLGFTAQQPGLEAQVANLADEIAYYSHDLDDGLDAGLLSEERLAKSAEIWNQAAREVRERHGSLPDERRWYFVIRCLIDGQVRDVVEHTELQLLESGVGSADDVRRHREPLVGYSPERRRQNAELREFLYRELYFNPRVHEPNERASRMLEKLFHHYLEHPSQVGDLTRRRADTPEWPRAVCDYISGMTDRYAIQEYERVFGPQPTGSAVL